MAARSAQPAPETAATRIAEHLRRQAQARHSAMNSPLASLALASNAPTPPSLPSRVSQPAQPRQPSSMRIVRVAAGRRRRRPGSTPVRDDPVERVVDGSLTPLEAHGRAAQVAEHGIAHQRRIRGRPAPRATRLARSSRPVARRHAGPRRPVAAALRTVDRSACQYSIRACGRQRWRRAARTRDDHGVSQRACAATHGAFQRMRRTCSDGVSRLDGHAQNLLPRGRCHLTGCNEAPRRSGRFTNEKPSAA